VVVEISSETHIMKTQTPATIFRQKDTPHHTQINTRDGLDVQDIIRT